MNKNIKLKVGDILTYQFSNEKVVETTVEGRAGISIKELENLHPSCKVLKLERPQTIYKFKEVLDAKEKEYLSAVIRPFKNRIKNIHKVELVNYEYIRIEIEIPSFCDGVDDAISLPLFKKGTMYKGMKLSKEYTLKELGLD